ncbi:MAG TPA: hypothetical protein VMT15_06490 [Bryobacteraceae bacterium]|nr:hypothetical protein [Bryobacteraceae bacterium]
MNSFLRDVRKPALLAAVTGALAYLWPLWNASRMSRPGLLISLAAIVSQYISVAFYFALSRHPEPFRLSAAHRRLCLIAAIVFGIVVAATLPGWIQSVGIYVNRARAFGLAGDSEALTQAAQLALQLSSLSYLLLLIVMSRAPDADSSPNAPLSGPLEVLGRVSVMLGGLWLVFGIVVTAYWPSQIWSNRLAIVAAHQQSQVVQSLVLGPVRGMITAACIFVTPYVVSMSRRAATQVEVQVDPLPLNADS